MFFKIGVLKILAIFKGKHLCWSLVLTKLHGFRCFPVNSAKLLRAAFLQNTSGGCFCKCSVLHYIFKKTLLNILYFCIAQLFHSETQNHSYLLSFVVPLVAIRCYSLSFIVTRCHLLSLFVTRCTTRHSLYYSLSLAVICCTPRCHSLSLVVPLVVTRCHSMYHSLSLIVTRRSLFNFTNSTFI